VTTEAEARGEKLHQQDFPSQAAGSVRGASIGAACQSSQRVVCSWCGEVLSAGIEPATHGICVICDRRVRESAGLPPPDYGPAIAQEPRSGVRS